MRSVNFPAFIYGKRGIFYFGRRVPRDLQRFCGSPKVVLSLRTESVRKADRHALGPLNVELLKFEQGHHQCISFHQEEVVSISRRIRQVELKR